MCIQKSVAERLNELVEEASALSQYDEDDDYDTRGWDAQAQKCRGWLVAADVRTRATHAQWDEFDDNDLKTTVEFTEEMILEHVDNLKCG